MKRISTVPFFVDLYNWNLFCTKPQIRAHQLPGTDWFDA